MTQREYMQAQINKAMETNNAVELKAWTECLKRLDNGAPTPWPIWPRK